MRHVSPLGAGSKLSVVQADKVIIALPGEKSKMSIGGKIPPLVVYVWPIVNVYLKGSGLSLKMHSLIRSASGSSP